MFFVVVAKIVVLVLPFAYAGAVDAMSKGGDEALWVAMALVVAYQIVARLLGAPEPGRELTDPQSRQAPV